MRNVKGDELFAILRALGLRERRWIPDSEARAAHQIVVRQRLIKLLGGH
jgi:hypothetical protein